MFRLLTFLIFISFSFSIFAEVNIELACKEKTEQQRSLLTELSTSFVEAHLAGQCTGYKFYNIKDFEWEETCSEFSEQKESLLTSLSTSLKEAHLAGMCVGAIYRVAKQCRVNTKGIDYSYVARGVSTLHQVKQLLRCNGESNAW